MTDKGDDNDTSVRVAVRIRPQLAREKIDMCQVCTHVTPGEPQIFLGKDKSYTYDVVFDINSTQEECYKGTARELIEGTFEGYNATVFAYGQTGSGKTYTMGTGFDLNAEPQYIGIIPRAVEHLFKGIEKRRIQALDAGEPIPEFKVNATFMELYNEEILDLLDTTRDTLEGKGHKSSIRIHENANGDIYTVGVTARPVASLQDTMQCLKIGALSRTTASTNMNSQSSRSHAIFTLEIKQQRIIKEERCEDSGDEENGGGDKGTNSSGALNEFETLTAKFHFVDLAGSERLKRTGATGERAKEGISINCGLLALGNVISALGDKQKKGCHVPYRDSKLTRLLQDSLGGNSRTVMIACVSPSDRDFMETLNTLKYANRARNIKNKVTVNQDKTSKQISILKSQISQLQQELLDYKTGKRIVDGDGVETFNDMFHENTMLQTENNNLRSRIKAMQESIDVLTTRNIQLLAEKDSMGLDGEANEEVTKLVESYLRQIEEMRAKLIESEAMCESLKRTASRAMSRASVSPMHSSLTVPLSSSSIGGSYEFSDDLTTMPDNDYADLLSQAKKELKTLKTKSMRLRESSISEHTEKEGISEDEKQDHESVEHPDDESQEKEEEEEEDFDFGGDDEDEEEEISDRSDSDEESGKLHEDLADLTCEISIRQKMIEEVEKAQRRLETMKGHYESKLLLLESKIKETEIERDRVLQNLESVESHSQENSKKIKDEYDKKLNEMKNEMKKIHAAKKEHAKLLRNQQQSETRLKVMQKDLADMKRTKVKLMQQIKDESQKNRQSEMRRNREVAQLKKTQRQKDHQIKNLESEKKKRDIVLKRKQEEVEALRRRQRPMSVKTAGRTASYNKSSSQPVSNVGVPYKKRVKEFSAKVAKQKWDTVEKSLTSIILKKQTLSHMEKDMERWLKQRNNLGKKMEKVQKKISKSMEEETEQHVIQDLTDQLETLRNNISIVQDNINECQNNVVQMEEAKDDEFESSHLFNSCSVEESKYLLEHMMEMVIGKGLLAAQKDAENKELMAKLHHERMDSTFQRDMLQYLIQDQVDIEIDDSLLRNPGEEDDSDEDSDVSSRSASPVDGTDNPLAQINPMMAQMFAAGSTTGSGQSMQGSIDSLTGLRKDKVRKKTATPMDLLFGGDTGSVEASPVSPLKTVPENPEGEHGTKRLQSPSSHQPETSTMTPAKGLPSQTSKSTNSTTRQGSTTPIRPTPEPSPSMGRKNKPEPSPSMRRKLTANQSVPPLPVSRQNSNGDNEFCSPPSSPTLNRRNRDSFREGNVFKRLTSSGQQLNILPNRGTISQVGAHRMVKDGPLVHSHTAEGHSKAVLSVFATDDLLFSSSKDRTAKVWDLESGEEILTLDGHPNNVVSVRYSEETKLVYTVSTYMIKIWDIRDRGTRCIKTLTSSGLTHDGAIPISASSRQATCPTGETTVNDIAVNSTGSVLYTAAGNSVRIWDLRCFKAVGKLSGGHQAAIMVLAVDDTDTADGNICVVTGSKDHYIKVFDVMEDSVGVLTPKYNLEPPHYDGIQSLCLMGDLLFSGSRDMCIKKWDLAEQQLKQSINNSHKDWICGLAFMPGGNGLLSGCRGGTLKLWDIDQCQQMGEIKAHNSPINAITTNSNLIFTASNDRTINIWQSPPPGGSLDTNA